MKAIRSDFDKIADASRKSALVSLKNVNKNFSNGYKKGDKLAPKLEVNEQDW